jgi:hypothetical protein
MTMTARPRIRWPIVAVAVVTLVGGIITAWMLWTPGSDFRDGRHDRGSNALWLAHGWMGADDWFIRNDKTNQFSKYREPANVRALAQRLHQHHIVTVYPHLCPTSAKGDLPPINPNQVEAFLNEMVGVRVIPWIGGPNPSAVDLTSTSWRATFCAGAAALLAHHPRLAGVQVNIEPLPDGDANFLLLLDELRRALPKEKALSIAAYPPPTRWHPFPEVHWGEAYLRQVARRVDELAFMMYDTALEEPRLYEHLMASWTREVLAWSEGRAVLLGVPTYHDAGVGYHDPAVENLPTALRGIHAGLSQSKDLSSYVGLAIYSDWETDEPEWQHLRKYFLRP